MFTEEQLLKYERDLLDWLTTKEDIRALIAEVRRLNACYRKTKKMFSGHNVVDGCHSFAADLALIEIFEPEKSG